MTANQISYAKLREDSRHNASVEALTDQAQRESARSNRAQEMLKSQAQLIDQRYKEGSLALGQSQLAESIRHNRANERKDMLMGISTLDESKRSNVAREELDRQRTLQQGRIAQLQLNEQTRSNLAQERIAGLRRAEEVRHNSVSEDLSRRDQDLRSRIASQQMLNQKQISAASNLTSIQTAAISSFSALARSMIGGMMYAKR